MAISTISLHDCGYSLYYYYLKNNKQYVPIFVIELPYKYDDLNSLVAFSDGGTYLRMNDLGLSNIEIPFWYSSQESGILKSYYEVYDDGFLNLNTSYGSSPYWQGILTGRFTSEKMDDVYFNILSNIQYSSTHYIWALIPLFYHTTDDKYLSNGGLNFNYDWYSAGYNEMSKVAITQTIESQDHKGKVTSNSYNLLQLTNFNLYNTYDTRADSLIREILGKSKKIDVNDPNSGSGDSSGDGGGSSDDIGGDTHEGGSTPTISPINSGLITAYNPTVNDLQELGRFLWSDAFSVDTFKKLFGDPFDTLIGLSIMPVKPILGGNQNIIFGNIDSGVPCNVISSQWVDAECGSFNLNQVWNGALDYSPYTQVSIYLPFIGVKQLNVNDVMGSTLTLKYHFDILTGGCVAEIFINHTGQGNKSGGFSYNSDMGCVYTFSGQCGVNIPLSSLDYTNSIRAMISAVGIVAGASASIASGNAALGNAMLAVGAANSTIQANTPTVERSGSLGSSSAFLSSLQPCLFVTRPHICKPQNYYALRGVPSQVYVSALSKCTGFFQISDLQNICASGASDTELTEIKNLLLQGVYVKSWTLSEDLPITSGLTINLYNNSSSKNQIDKTLSGIKTGLEGDFKDECNLENPVIRLKIDDVSDLNHVNYMYIGRFQRYYYITKIVSLRTNIVEITGHVDVLMTYSHQIGNNSAILARSSKVGSGQYGNTYLDDAQLATYQDTYNVCYNWGYSFSHTNDSLILAVAGASS